MTTGISGSMTAQASTYIVARVSYSEEYNTSSNTSSVTATLAYRRTNSYSGTTQSTGAFYVTINGEQCLVYNGLFTIPANNSDWHTVGSATVNGISHNTDGSKTISIGGSHSGSISPFYMNFSTSKSVDLTKIPRASKPTVSKDTLILNGTDSVVISTNRASSSFTHRITVAIDGFSHVETNVGESYTFKPTPSYWMPYMNVYRKKATVTCETYNGSTKLGTNSTSFYLQIDTDAECGEISSYTLSDSNSATAAVTEQGTFIRSASDLVAVINIAAQGDYTTLVKATVECGSVSQSFNLSGTTGTITFNCPDVSSDIITVSITDNHGYINGQQIQLTLIDYEPVQIVTASIIRVNEKKQPSDTGDYLLCNVEVTGFAGSFGSTSNSITLSYKSKPASAQAYGSDTVLETQTASGTGQVTQIMFRDVRTGGGYSSSAQYDVIFTVTDIFSTASYQAIRVHEGLPVAGWGSDHFDIYGEFHCHDREDATQYLTYGMNYNDEKSSVLAYCHGYITSSGQVAVLFIPFTMLPLDPEITSLLCSVRTVDGGYLGGNNNSNLKSQVELITILKEQSALRILLRNTSGYGITNNTPLCGEVTISYRRKENNA